MTVAFHAHPMTRACLPVGLRRQRRPPGQGPQRAPLQGNLRHRAARRLCPAHGRARRLRVRQRGPTRHHAGLAAPHVQPEEPPGDRRRPPSRVAQADDATPAGLRADLDDSFCTDAGAIPIPCIMRPSAPLQCACWWCPRRRRGTWRTRGAGLRRCARHARRPQWPGLRRSARARLPRDAGRRSQGRRAPRRRPRHRALPLRGPHGAGAPVDSKNDIGQRRISSSLGTSAQPTSSPPISPRSRLLGQGRASRVAARSAFRRPWTWQPLARARQLCGRRGQSSGQPRFWPTRITAAEWVRRVRR